MERFHPGCRDLGCGNRDLGNRAGLFSVYDHIEILTKKIRLRGDLSRRAKGSFPESSEAFRACKAIFSSSVSKNGEVYTPETSCMK